MSTYDDAAINRAVGELHEWACTFGTDGKACMRGPDLYSLSHYGYVEKVFNSLERAPWWREVTDPDEGIPAGCPVRTEAANGFAREWSAGDPHSTKRDEWSTDGDRVFVDTRWTPPVKPLRVGDVIETVEDAERFTDYDYGKAVVIDRDGDVWRTAGKGHLNLDSGKNAAVDVLRNYGPLTVIHVLAVDE